MKQAFALFFLLLNPLAYSDVWDFYNWDEGRGMTSQIVELNAKIQIENEELTYNVDTPYYNTGEIRFERNGVKHTFKIRPLYKEGDFVNLEITYLSSSFQKELRQLDFKTLVEIESPWKIKIQGRNLIIFTLTLRTK